jgi:phosphatidylinositol alpha-mannosyltransferase
VTFLGMLADKDKARFLHSVDVYVAPNTGGESFGIVLLEAAAAATPIVASDLDAFRAVLDDGAAGELVPVGDPVALAQALDGLLGDADRRAALAEAGRALAWRYDWSVIARQVIAVYETVTHGEGVVVTDTRS